MHTIIDEKIFYENLPKKRVSAHALFFDGQDRLLLVKQSYRDEWSIPGGMGEKDESPRETCVREVKEEIGLDIDSPEFVCVNWLPASGSKPEALHFLFNGGILDDEKIKEIKIDNAEIIDCAFMPLKEAEKLFGKNSFFAQRIVKAVDALRNGQAIYLEDADK